jgi:CRISPR-associated protein Cas1
MTNADKVATLMVLIALLNAGLEPYCGFFHTTRAGKPSLVLDIMEEYRAWVVDRTI